MCLVCSLQEYLKDYDVNGNLRTDPHKIHCGECQNISYQIDGNLRELKKLVDDPQEFGEILQKHDYVDTPLVCNICRSEMYHQDCIDECRQNSVCQICVCPTCIDKEGDVPNEVYLLYWTIMNKDKQIQKLKSENEKLKKETREITD